MTRNKLVAILSIVALLAILVVLFFIFVYKGTLVVTPQTKEIKMTLNNKQVYTELPAKIRLRAGEYKVQFSKDGYITQTTKIEVAPFKSITMEPVLKEEYLVNYFDRKNFLGPVFSPSGDYIFYYDPAGKMFMRLPALYTRGKVANIAAEAVSNPVGGEVESSDIKVSWSPNRTKAALVTADSAIVYDLTGRTQTALKNIEAIGFINEKQILYSATGGGLFKAQSDGSGATKMADTTFKTTGIELSRDQSLAAVYGEKLAIYNLTNGAILKIIEKPVNAVNWGENNKVAFSQAKGDDSELYWISMSGNPIDLGLINKMAFVWQKDTLLYASKINYRPKLNALDTQTNIKDTLFTPRIYDQPRILLTSANKLIFSSEIDRGRLLAIILD